MHTKKLFFMLCCFALVGGLALAGCGDDDSKDDNDTTIAPDTVDDDTNVTPDGDDPDVTSDPDAGDPDTVDTCDQAACAAQGLTCPATGTECVAVETGCAAANEACTLADEQPSGWVCADLDETGTTGYCSIACVAEPTDSCPNGSFCADLQDGTPAFCVESQCTGFFADAATECGSAEANCIPVGNGANLCMAAGAAAEGESCVSYTDCGAGLLCVGTGENTAECFAPDCSPNTTAQTCADTTQICDGLGDLDIGFCTTMCDPFNPSATCGTDEQCFPVQRNSSTSALDGVCTTELGPYGPAQVGDNCSPTFVAVEEACDEGLFCLRVSDTESQCRSLCDPDATTGAGACGQQETCFTLQYTDGSETIFGICEQTCDPWDSANSGCNGTDICMPTLEIEDVGQCTPAGTLVEGDACGTSDFGSCGAGTMCLLTALEDPSGCTTNDQCVTAFGAGYFCDPNDGQCLAAECVQICDPRSTSGSGAEGACDTGDGCFALGTETQTFVLGTCSAACKYNETACADAAETCVSAWFVGYDTEMDLCFPADEVYDAALQCTASDGSTHAPPCLELETCTGVPADGTVICRGAGVCVELAGITTGNQCVEFCDGANNGCGITDHPMCSRDTATCSCMFGDPTFGVCGQDG